MPLSYVDAIAAVTATAPYAYYAELVAASLLQDKENGIWLAASAAAVEAVLAEPLCRVRPVHEPVPKALQGSDAGTIFRHLVRMNDGAGHCPFKQAIAHTLQSVNAEHIAQRVGQHARQLAAELYSPVDYAWLDQFALQMPVYGMASALGVPEADLPEVAVLMQDFVACLAAGSSALQLEQGKQAAARLLALFRRLLEQASADYTASSPSLLFTLAQQAALLGRVDADVIVANAIGFMSQAYEATAALIANTLHVLACNETVRRQVAADPAFLHGCIAEVLRWDAPVQNTRRFAAEDCRVLGHTVRAGDTVLVVLAAANRDPAWNPQADVFDPRRRQRRCFSFGSGVHLCPGQQWAAQMAHAAISQLCGMPLDFSRLAKARSFRASANIRMRLYAGT
ncbi:cytochrome P450 [Undibacterium sp. TJN25]|uniref:cytochrome P450 n=1 Tax=Undibacterium sp. TJN25 TaxID=3413056 RepID=UPI003BF20D8F